MTEKKTISFRTPHKESLEKEAERRAIPLSDLVNEIFAKHFVEGDSEEIASITTENGEFMINDGKLWRKRESQFNRKTFWDEVKDLDESESVAELRKEKYREEILLLRAKRFEIAKRHYKQSPQSQQVDLNQCPKCKLSFPDASDYERRKHVDYCRGRYAYTEESLAQFILAAKEKLSDIKE